MGLREFLLEAGPPTLHDLWTISNSEEPAAAQPDGEPPTGPADYGDPPPAPPDAAAFTLADALRLGDSAPLLQQDGVVRLFLFALLQQLLAAPPGARSCQPEGVAVTPQLWPRALDPAPDSGNAELETCQPQPQLQPPSGCCPYDLRGLTARWQDGRLSTYDYLMELNRLAGQRLGDPGRSPIMPWVLDFMADPGEGPPAGAGVGDAEVRRAGTGLGARLLASAPQLQPALLPPCLASSPSTRLPTHTLSIHHIPRPPAPAPEQQGSAPAPGWRDLCRSKWRLAKGDEQLDHTYATSPVPHHLPGHALSDVTYCIYKVGGRASGRSCKGWCKVGAGGRVGLELRLAVGVGVGSAGGAPTSDCA